jgi:type IV secretion system protein VirD4
MLQTLKSPNGLRWLLTLTTVLLLSLFVLHVAQELILNTQSVIKRGPAVLLGLRHPDVPSLLAKCALTFPCWQGLIVPTVRSINPVLLGLAGLLVLAAPFWWIVLSPRKRMLYNSRWATVAQLAKVTHRVNDPLLAEGVQVAHAWANYPTLAKNRHGYLTLPAWGDRAGPSGGRVIANTISAKRRELSHLLVVGPTRSGKGLMITQNLLVWEGNAIVNDPKGENHRLTAAFRKAALGQRICVIDPRGFGDRFDPFEALNDSPESLRAAANLILEVEAMREPIFAQRSANALYAGLYAAKLAGCPTLPFLREATRHGLVGYITALLEYGDAEVNQALTDFLNQPPDQPISASDKFLQAAWSTMTTKLSPLFSPGVLASSSGSDLRVTDLVQQHTTVYLRFNESDLAFTRSYLGLVWLAFSSCLIDCADQFASGSLPIKTLLVLDEAKAVPMPNLANAVSTLAGRGLTALIFVQDLSQLEAAYGEEDAQTVMANCKTQVFFKTPEQATRRLVSERAGRLMVAEKTVQKSKDGYRSLERELIAPDEVERLHEENVIVFMDNQLPILARRLNYLEHRAWRAAQVLTTLPVPRIGVPFAGAGQVKASQVKAERVSGGQVSGGQADAGQVETLEVTASDKPEPILESLVETTVSETTTAPPMLIPLPVLEVTDANRVGAIKNSDSMESQFEDLATPVNVTLIKDVEEAQPLRVESESQNLEVGVERQHGHESSTVDALQVEKPKRQRRNF